MAGDLAQCRWCGQYMYPNDQGLLHSCAGSSTFQWQPLTHQTVVTKDELARLRICEAELTRVRERLRLAEAELSYRIEAPYPGERWWTCKIGPAFEDELPSGSDTPMRHAIKAAFKALTGHNCAELFSGWHAQPTVAERACAENREPTDHEYKRTLRQVLEVETDLRSLLNRHSAENGSDTPDFIVTEYLMASLAAFDAAVNARSQWYNPQAIDAAPEPKEK